MMDLSNVLTIIGLLFVVVGAIATMWWRLSTKISVNAALMHARIEKTREDYVRRDDLAGHLKHLEEGQDQIITAQGQMNNRLDQFVLHLVKVPPPKTPD